ncbi:MAG TPA: type IV toxin-antitoxin system AbiEi family antitoxin domain-containing protein [Ktedonobacterales bacterium]|nr:type IV toxin-antitoxin system AbiEi family antitoxin domain-containing protein [Ktedonobacterales bacterium]
MAETKAARVIEWIRRAGIVRPRDLASEGVTHQYLQSLYRRGLLERRGRGLYSVAGAEFDERETLSEVAMRAPHGVICLLSALRFHDLTTQAPYEVWLAVEHSAHVPQDVSLPLHAVYFSGRAFTEGIEEREVNGVTLRVYSPAKTVADCFKYRNKIGLDVALEALRETWRERRATMDDLWRYAAICRVTNVMRPYLTALETLT